MTRDPSYGRVQEWPFADSGDWRARGEVDRPTHVHVHVYVYGGTGEGIRWTSTEVLS